MEPKPVFSGANDDVRRRISVLIVEDSDDARESLALLVELEGRHVIKASDGMEALRMVRTGQARPCAIVLDLLMPGMDGLTGHERARREALAMGCTAALLKPAKPAELLRLIGHHCPPIA